MILEQIRVACIQGKIQWRNHALERMMERNISREQVKNVLLQGDIIALYQDDRPFPSLFLDGRVEDDILHVVTSFDEKSLCCYIITAYRPDLEHFEKDMKTRRKS